MNLSQQPYAFQQGYLARLQGKPNTPPGLRPALRKQWLAGYKAAGKVTGGTR